MGGVALGWLHWGGVCVGGAGSTKTTSAPNLVRLGFFGRGVKNLKSIVCVLLGGLLCCTSE